VACFVCCVGGVSGFLDNCEACVVGYGWCVALGWGVFVGVVGWGCCFRAKSKVKTRSDPIGGKHGYYGGKGI